MELDFYLLQVDNYTIKVIDNTAPNQISPINIINSMTLDIIGSNVLNGGVYSIDIIPYIKTYKRDKEIYEITSEVLGLGSDTIIPDGTYTLTWVINNMYTTTHIFCVYNTIRKAINELLTNVNYNVEVTTTDVDLIGDYCNGDIEQVRLAQAMLDSLRVAAAIGSKTQCNDLIDKLNRLLTIINSQYGKSNYRR